MRLVKGMNLVSEGLRLVFVHNLMMVGPPGAGKTLLARAMPGILPRLSMDEALEVTRIYSVADMIPEGTPLVRVRPFRAPHHTISHAGLVGGGHWPRPGEVSLAHRGVLFLDELPEFGTRNLETLRQPIEDHVLTISRASGSLTFPASFMLIAAMNPCPCGYFGDPTHECTCSLQMVSRYQKRISGPLLDRIDIHVEVPAVDYDKLSDERLGEPSASIRARVKQARAVQRTRFAGTGLTACDRRSPRHGPGTGAGGVHGRCDGQGVAARGDGGPCVGMGARGVHGIRMSARAYHRILKLARTIADMAGSDGIAAPHLASATARRLLPPRSSTGPGGWGRDERRGKPACPQLRPLAVRGLIRFPPRNIALVYQEWTTPGFGPCR